MSAWPLGWQEETDAPSRSPSVPGRHSGTWTIELLVLRTQCVCGFLPLGHTCVSSVLLVLQLGGQRNSSDQRPSGDVVISHVCCKGELSRCSLYVHSCFWSQACADILCGLMLLHLPGVLMKYASSKLPSCASSPALPHPAWAMLLEVTGWLRLGICSFAAVARQI